MPWNGRHRRKAVSGDTSDGKQFSGNSKRFSGNSKRVSDKKGGHYLRACMRFIVLYYVLLTYYTLVDRPSAMTPWGIYPGRKIPALSWGLLVPSTRRGLRKDTMVDGWRPRRCWPSCCHCHRATTAATANTAVKITTIHGQRKRQHQHHHQRTNGSTNVKTFRSPDDLDLFYLPLVSREFSD
jgi:hypothetical protein